MRVQTNDISGIKPAVEIGKLTVEKEKPKETEGKKAIAKRQPTEKEIEEAIKKLNDFISVFNTKIALEVDKETKKTILKIIDVNSDKVIRQIPPEEMLEISRRITELLGLIINEKV